jgi:hypothetical protein
MSSQEFSSKLEVLEAIQSLFTQEVSTLHDSLLHQLRENSGEGGGSPGGKAKFSVEYKVKTIRNLGQTMTNVVKNIVKE